MMSASLVCRASVCLVIMTMVMIPIISQFSLTNHFTSLREIPAVLAATTALQSPSPFEDNALAAQMRSLLEDIADQPVSSVSLPKIESPEDSTAPVDTVEIWKQFATTTLTCPEAPKCEPCSTNLSDLENRRSLEMENKRSLEDSATTVPPLIINQPLEQTENIERPLTYYETFKPFLDQHEHFWKSQARTLPTAYREYEPYTYTDDVKLQYDVKGLQNISVQQETSFFVDTHNILNANSQEEFVRVLFYGIAVFCPQRWIPHPNGVWEAKFQFHDPGLYHVHIESVKRTKQDGLHQYRAIAGSPFTLLVRPAGTEHMSDEAVIELMHSHGLKSHSSSRDHKHRHARHGSTFAHHPIGKVHYPKELCTDARWRPGRWVRCLDTPEPCIRTGWIWLPEACHYHVFTPQEMVEVSKPVWIVIAGSSIQRGTFFAFIDLLAERFGGAKNLTNSPFWKCWGWMDFSMKNFRVSYLDFRTPYLHPQPNWVQNQYVEPQYFTNGLLALSELGKMDGEGPDLFYIEDQPPTIFLQNLFKSWLGVDWKGRFVIHSTKPPPALDLAGWRLQMSLEGVRQPFWDEFEGRSNSGFELVDEDRLTLPFMHDQEQLMWKGVSQHFHRSCDDSGMYSCSVICDMTAQQLLNVFFNSPKIYERKNLRPVHSMGDDFSFCLRCPKELVPFTIKPTFTGVKCYDHIPS